MQLSHVTLGFTPIIACLGVEQNLFREILCTYITTEMELKCHWRVEFN